MTEPPSILLTSASQALSYLVVSMALFSVRSEVALPLSNTTSVGMKPMSGSASLL